MSKKSKTNTHTYKHNYNTNNKSHSIANSKSLLDFKIDKSITIFTKINDIKTSTNIGDFYNLLEIHDTMNKNCLNKVQNKYIDGIKLNKIVAKNICTCLFDKNQHLTIQKLENHIKENKHTPGSQCITILDKYLQNEKLKKKSSKSSKSSKSPKSSKRSKSSKSSKNSKSFKSSKRSKH